jgi:hypothetical protein
MSAHYKHLLVAFALVGRYISGSMDRIHSLGVLCSEGNKGDQKPN